MLPLTTVNNDGQLNQPEKLYGQMKQLKSAGVDGYIAYSFLITLLYTNSDLIYLV